MTKHTFFLSNSKSKVDLIILISAHPSVSTSLPSLLVPKIMKYQGKSGQSTWVWAERPIPLQPQHSHRNTPNWLPELFSWEGCSPRRINLGMSIQSAEVPPHCMNTVCCRLPLDHPGVPSTTGSVSPEGGGGLAGQGLSEPAGSRGTRDIPKCKRREKATLWAKSVAPWNPVHLAADGCAVLDLAMPLEKTTLVALSVPFSICTYAQTSVGHASRKATEALSNIWKGEGIVIYLLLNYLFYFELKVKLQESEPQKKNF